MNLLARSFALVLFSVPGVMAGTSYHITQKIPVPGNGGWDYATCDSVMRRLYVSHHNQTQVLDIDALTIVGSIPNTTGVHGIALATDLGRGFISAGGDNKVVIFDLKTLSPLGTVRTGENPDAIVYDPGTKRVFVFNGKSRTVTILNADDQKLVTALPLGGKPEFAVADGRGFVYVALQDQNQILKINSRVIGIDSRWTSAPCEDPSSMAIDAAANRLFVGCRNKEMAVFDTLSGKVITTLPIGAKVDATIFEPETKLIFNINGDGTVTVISQEAGDHYSVVQKVRTQAGARTAALDEGTHRLFIPVAKLGPLEHPTFEHPEARPTIVSGTFAILVVAP